MDAKTPLLPRHEAQAEPETMPRRRGLRRLSRFHAAAFAVLLGLFWLAQSWQFFDNDNQSEPSKVPLEVHIMSKCPDARDCLQKFVLPAMEKVSDKVNFRLSFIGKVTNEDDGVQCMHGQTECLGNIIELCAAHLYPDPKIYLGFTMCLSKSYSDIPKRDLIEECALEHSIEFSKLNECMSADDGANGMAYLRESVQRSAALNVTTSCTVRLDNKTRCVVDGGKFRNCTGGAKPGDLVKDINSLYDVSRGRSE